MGTTPEPFECVARPGRRVRTIGTVIVAVIVLVSVGALLAEGFDPLTAAVLGACTSIVVTLMAWVCVTPARLRLDCAGIHASYRPFQRSVTWSQVEEIARGDRVDGVGFGYGWRWEGAGRTAVRVGGPMVTVVHSGGRLGVSVPDPDAVLAAAGRWRSMEDQPLRRR